MMCTFNNNKTFVIYFIITAAVASYIFYKTQAYLFYGSYFDGGDLPLPKNDTPWAILHEESPKNLAMFLSKNGQKLFNFTSTFSQNSDLPLTFLHLKNFEQITSKKYYMPVEQKNKLLKDNNLSPILYIQSSCDNPMDRDKYVQEIMEYISVDLYGLCLNNRNLPESLNMERSFEDDTNFLEFIKQYKFIITIENSKCKDYITEKLWSALSVGAIPIYFGAPNIEEWLPNKKSSLILNNFPSIIDLVQEIKKINGNDSLYNEYMGHKLYSKVSNEKLLQKLKIGNYGLKNYNNEEVTFMETFECSVCEKVHKNYDFKRKFKNVYDCEVPHLDNSWFYHWKIGMCQAKALDHLINELNLANYSEQEYEKLYLDYFNKNDC